jgi:molybdopterin molybdotransferase
MISVQEALAHINALAEPVAGESVALPHAHGRWVSAAVTAQRDQPAAALSAMDGYAVRYAQGVTAWQLVGEAQAGHACGVALEADTQAVRIFTGAALPMGADSVIMQEAVARAGAGITLLANTPLKQGQHVRTQGSDFHNGQVIIPANTRLNAAHIGLAAMAGYAALPVRRKIRVALLSTGDELVPLGAPCLPHQIPASNGVMLAAMLVHHAVELQDLELVRDTLPDITSAIEKAGGADILVTIGGASVGDHDLIVPALKQVGAQIAFHKIAMRPGKPFLLGKRGKQIIIGLPGNPVSAFVTAQLFLLPLLAALNGAPQATHPSLSLPLAHNVAANDARAHYIRASLTHEGVVPQANHDSAALQALSCAQALIIRPAHAPAVKAGEQVQVIIL